MTVSPFFRFRGSWRPGYLVVVDACGNNRLPGTWLPTGVFAPLDPNPVVRAEQERLIRGSDPGWPASEAQRYYFDPRLHSPGAMGRPAAAAEGLGSPMAMELDGKGEPEAPAHFAFGVGGADDCADLVNVCKSILGDAHFDGVKAGVAAAWLGGMLEAFANELSETPGAAGRVQSVAAEIERYRTSVLAMNELGDERAELLVRATEAKWTAFDARLEAYVSELSAEALKLDVGQALYVPCIPFASDYCHHWMVVIAHEARGWTLAHVEPDLSESRAAVLDFESLERHVSEGGSPFGSPTTSPRKRLDRWVQARDSEAAAERIRRFIRTDVLAVHAIRPPRLQKVRQAFGPLVQINLRSHSYRDAVRVAEQAFEPLTGRRTLASRPDETTFESVQLGRSCTWTSLEHVVDARLGPGLARQRRERWLEAFVGMVQDALDWIDAELPDMPAEEAGALVSTRRELMALQPKMQALTYAQRYPEPSASPGIPLATCGETLRRVLEF